MEHIALHSASGFQGAQFYISCSQINVSGGGSGTPGPLVSIPGVYNGRVSALKYSPWPTFGSNYRCLTGTWYYAQYLLP